MRYYVESLTKSLAFSADSAPAIIGRDIFDAETGRIRIEAARKKLKAAGKKLEQADQIAQQAEDEFFEREQLLCLAGLLYEQASLTCLKGGRLSGGLLFGVTEEGISLDRVFLAQGMRPMLLEFLMKEAAKKILSDKKDRPVVITCSCREYAGFFESCMSGAEPVRETVAVFSETGKLMKAVDALGRALKEKGIKTKSEQHYGTEPVLNVALDDGRFARLYFINMYQETDSAGFAPSGMSLKAEIYQNGQLLDSEEHYEESGEEADRGFLDFVLKLVK